MPIELLEDFEFIQRYTPKELEQFVPEGIDTREYLSPYDYPDLFSPKPAELLRKIIGAATPVGSQDAPSTPSNDTKPTNRRGVADLL